MSTIKENKTHHGLPIQSLTLQRQIFSYKQEYHFHSQIRRRNFNLWIFKAAQLPVWILTSRCWVGVKKAQFPKTLFLGSRCFTGVGFFVKAWIARSTAQQKDKLHSMLLWIILVWISMQVYFCEQAVAVHYRTHNLISGKGGANKNQAYCSVQWKWITLFMCTKPRNHFVLLVLVEQTSNQIDSVGVAWFICSHETFIGLKQNGNS